MADLLKQTFQGFYRTDKGPTSTFHPLAERNMVNPHIRESETQGALENLNPNKGAGPNGIFPKALKTFKFRMDAYWHNGSPSCQEFPSNPPPIRPPELVPSYRIPLLLFLVAVGSSFNCSFDQEKLFECNEHTVIASIKIHVIYLVV